MKAWITNLFRGTRRAAPVRKPFPAPSVELLEARTVPAAQLLPDLHVLADDLSDYEVFTQGERTLIRFSTTMANGGQGAFEIRGANPPEVVGELERVYQRIYNDDGTFGDRAAGTFEYHPGHGHVHYSGFAQNRLRVRGPNGEVGEVVATGDKTSFALLDLRHYAPGLPGSPTNSVYGSGGRVQGISVGWADVYNRFLEGQNIDITGVRPGDYWLEVEADPNNAVVELNETNNVTRIPITIRADEVPFAGLDVISSTPAGATAGPVNNVQITFRKAVDPTTFTAADVSFTRDGESVEVTGVAPVAGSNNTKFTISFATQTRVATYYMNIGPDITASDGDVLDQNRNEVGGEQADVYTAIFAITTPRVVAGPDAYGYRLTAPVAFEDVNLEPGQTGVFTALDNVDDGAAAIDLGTNTFNFYGVNYTGANKLFVSSNGLISFGSAFTAYDNDNLTSGPEQPVIAVLWDDWRTDGGSDDRVLYRFDDANGDGRAERLVIEWSNIRSYGAGTDDGATFQAILNLNTGTRAGDVVLNYADLTVSDPNYDDGGAATVGIKAAGVQGDSRLLGALNGSSPYIREGGAVRFAVAPPSPAITPTYVVSAAANSSAPGALTSVRVTFSNAINPSTFTAADVSAFVGPDGAPAGAVTGVTAVAGSGNRQFDITFAGLTAVGAYSLTFGPQITDTTGRRMDQDRDWIGGEAGADSYTAEFSVVYAYRAVATNLEQIDLVAGAPGVVTVVDGQDDGAAAFNLGANTFTIYGQTFSGTDLFISSNGLISFEHADDSYSNTNLTSEPHHPAIAALWDDWRTDANANDVVLATMQDLNGDGVMDRLVIEWTLYRFGASTTNSVRFQAILELNTGSRPGDVVLQYFDLNVGNSAYNNGASATVGIKDDGAQGDNRLLVSFDKTTNGLVGEGRAVRLTVS
jgi:hypothetical protein